MIRLRSIWVVIVSLMLAAVVIWRIRVHERSGEVNSVPSSKSMTIAHNLPQDSPVHQSLIQFAQRMQLFFPDVKLTVEPEQRAGPDAQVIDRLLAGEFDLVIAPTTHLSHLFPPVEYVDLPFVFQSRDDANAQLDGALGGKIRAGLEKQGLKCFEHFDSGFKHFTSKKVLRTPEDLRGLKFRTMRSSVLTEQFRLWGALPVQIDAHQISRAAADGAVDGSENSLIEIEQLNLSATQRNLTVSNHGYAAQLPCLNAAKFASLPQGFRDIFVRELKTAILQERNSTQQREKNALEKIATSGMQIERLSEAERLEFARATFSLRSESVVRWNRDFALGLPPPVSLDDSSADNPTPMRKEWVVGINADLSLGAATAGKSIVAGAEFAAAEINSKGGLLGHPLRIEVLDHGGINLRGIANLQKFSKVHGLIGVVGGIHSNVILSELDYVHQEKIPYLIPWAAAVDIVDNGRTPNYVFRLGARDEYVAEFLVREALRSSKRVALLLESTVWGRSCLQAIEKALQARGLKPVTVQWVDRGASEVNVQAAALGAAGAEMLLMVLNSPEGALTVKTLAERGSSIRVLSHWGITSHNFFKETKDELRKISVEFFQPFTFARVPSAQASEILKFFVKKNGPVTLDKIQAPAGFAHTYDLVRILSAAVKIAGHGDRSAIRDALERVPEYRGLSRTFNPVFTAQRHEALDPSGYFLAKFNSEGSIVSAESKIP